jgi:hypothetical protein
MTREAADDRIASRLGFDTEGAKDADRLGRYI